MNKIWTLLVVLVLLAGCKCATKKLAVDGGSNSSQETTILPTTVGGETSSLASGEFLPEGQGGANIDKTLDLATQMPPSATPFPTWTSSPTSLPRVTKIPTWTPTPSPIPNQTPVPTFTPPPQDPIASQELDHYWLQRPIPPEFANWTDRIYPYGSTRGGYLPTHHGVEFFNPVGVAVLAAGDGIVVKAGSDDLVLYGPQADFYGKLVVIRHDQLYRDKYLYTLYGHLSEVTVVEEQIVTVGEQVGLVGGTGVANGGAHLHFEVRVGENLYNSTRNPELWISPFPGWGTIAGRLLWPDGTYVYSASLIIRRIDNPALFVERTVYTYADSTVTPDDGWGENFTTPDLEPGPYEIIFRNAELNLSQKELVWVYAGQTSFVTIQLSATP